MIKINSLGDFKKYKSTEGYFIITDINGCKLHWHRCHAVDIGHFKEKVIENSNKSGQYFFTNDFFEGIEYPKIKKCEECRKSM